MKIKTAELAGAALDWAVAECEGKNNVLPAIDHWNRRHFTPSTDWSQGGPIIEREHIGIDWAGWNTWEAWDDKTMPAPRYTGPTPLIAAMRCYVASKLGDEVEVPDELA